MVRNNVHRINKQQLLQLTQEIVKYDAQFDVASFLPKTIPKQQPQTPESKKRTLIEIADDDTPVPTTPSSATKRMRFSNASQSIFETEQSKIAKCHRALKTLGQGTTIDESQLKLELELVKQAANV